MDLKISYPIQIFSQNNPSLVYHNSKTQTQDRVATNGESPKNDKKTKQIILAQFNQ